MKSLPYDTLYSDLLDSSSWVFIGSYLFDKDITFVFGGDEKTKLGDLEAAKTDCSAVTRF
jgi:hypothetical protein